MPKRADRENSRRGRFRIIAFVLIFVILSQGCEEFELRWWKVRLGAAGLNEGCYSAGELIGRVTSGCYVRCCCVYDLSCTVL